MLVPILIILAVLIAGVLGFAAMKPNTFRIERSIDVHAPAAKIFPLLNTLTSWASWSPWEKLDPAIQRHYSGAPSGVGAVYAYEGNRKVGAGRLEILESALPAKLKIQLDFFRPYKARNTCEFTLTPSEHGTQVVWTMYGPQKFMGKVMGMFMNMDALVGKDFETGLAQLKQVAEA